MLDYEVNKGISQTILSIKIGEVKPFDEFRYRMVKENRIQGVLPVDRKIENAKVVYDYDITGVQSIERRYQGKKFSCQDILQIYSGILQIMLQSEEYFLDISNFIITTQFVCYREEIAQFLLIYCPEYQKDSKEQMTEFTEYIMNRVNYEDKLAVAMVYELFKMLRNDHTTLKEILCYVETGGKKQQQIMPGGSQIPPVAAYQNPILKTPVIKRETPVYSRPEPVPNKNIPKKEEQMGVSTKKLLLCGAVLVAGLVLFSVCYLSGFFYTENGVKFDTSKLAGVVVILGAVLFYACYKIMGMEESEEEKKTVEKKERKKTVKDAQQTPPLTMPADWDWKDAQLLASVSCKPPEEIPKAPVRILQPELQVNQRPVIQQPIRKQFNQKTGVQVMQPPSQFAIPMPPVSEQNREKVRYRLVDQKGQSRQQFMIYKSPYIIGKSVEQVDGVIYSDAVSKVHAEFVIEDNNLYVIDMSSTNGTYVNKKKLPCNQKIQIQNGDLITIADRQYKLIS